MHVGWEADGRWYEWGQRSSFKSFWRMIVRSMREP